MSFLRFPWSAQRSEPHAYHGDALPTELQQRIAVISEARRSEELALQRKADVTAAFVQSLNSKGKPRRSFVLRNQGLFPGSTGQFRDDIRSGRPPLPFGRVPQSCWR
jgi:hypothetical protein